MMYLITAISRVLNSDFVSDYRAVHVDEAFYLSLHITGTAESMAGTHGSLKPHQTFP